MTMDNSKKVIIWIKELRTPFFTCTIVPVTLGTMIAWYEIGIFDLELFALTLIGMIAIHAGSNMIDDYFDYESGADRHPIYDRLESPFFGGSGVLVDGELKPEQVRYASLILFLLGGIIGGYLAIVRGLMILIIGVIGSLFGYFHAKHISARGLGEFSLFLNFGPLPVLGSFFVQTQIFSIGPFLASIPIGILMFCMLLINSIPDYIADKTVEKETIPVKIGRKKSAYLYIILIVLIYVSITISVLFEYIPRGTLIALTTIPLAAVYGKVVLGHSTEPNKMLPANLGTYLLHLSTGILLILGYFLSTL